MMVMVAVMMIIWQRPRWWYNEEGSGGDENM